MKRPPGLWVLLSAGVLWLSLQDVYGIRATALIFGKSTTTTTEATSPESSPQDETATESSTEAVSNVTKPTLTGIPQVDYIWDPNLPKELNGYNLSEYPFYERVPEDIDFKCDGLHDGFYASVPHKCQVYHHCLFGTRYDFLCANYTAFDQKTFICHFVSEVDCVNSKKYWHRNDALYQAASTTTLKPVILRTSPPPEYAAQPATPPPAAAPRPGGNRRRPLTRRRPYDYYEYDDEYDDYYDERPRFERRRKRPRRPRPRPVYDYEEEYEDDRYERRGSGRRNEDRRKPYDRRGGDDRRLERRRNNKDRRKYEDDDKIEDEDRVEEERKSEKRSGERGYHKRRPVDDEDDRRRNRPKGRPSDDYYEDEAPQKDKAPALPADKPIIKPTSGSSIYDRPRTAPRIKPPVPKNEANKYAYKPLVTKAPPAAAEEEEYYDDYEEEEVTPKSHRKSEPSDSRRHTTRREETRDTRKQTAPSRLRAQPSRDDSYEEEAPRRPYKPKYGTHHRERPRPVENKKLPPPEDDYEDYEEDVSKDRARPKEKSTTTTTTTTTTTPTTTTSTTTTTTTTTTPKPTTTTVKDLPIKPETIVRIVKRPFLPSRGGNPYTSRGLQPVGAKAVDKKPEIREESKEADNTETMEIKPIFKPSPVIIKMPLRQKYFPSQTDSNEDFKPVSNRPLIPPRQPYKSNKEYSGPRTTQKPKLPEPDPLDNIEEDEYDVTLNDALNPTLPNLPVRSFPTGFSSANDYSYNPRNRYVIEGASSDYVYQTKPVRQRFETVPYTGSQDHFVNTDADYKGQYSTINRQNLRPRLTQAYYTPF